MRRFRSGFVLTVIVLVGAALRLWYASAELHINRFEDEQYSLQNVRKIYHTGDFEPASGYYPSPVFTLPQVWALRASQSLYRTTGRPFFEAVGENGRLKPTGFLLTRAYQTLCGVLTLPLVFLIGRRLFGSRAGWLAALLLAFLPWTLHSSGYNKPDALLVMAVCLALHTSLRAAESARALDHTLAGLAIALAMSAKLTGSLTAVPLIVATCCHLFGAERWRRIGLLALSGLVSAVAFILVNPYWRAYLHFIKGLQRDYAGRTDATRLEVPLRVAEMHLDKSLFGPLLGSLALGAFLLLGAFWLRSWLRDFLRARRRDGGELWTVERVAILMFLVFPLAYTTAYAVQTSYFKPNNFLPIVPSTALALAWLLDAAWRRFAASLPPSWQTRPGVVGGLGAAAVLGLATMVFLPGFFYVERSVVPTTYDVARNWLQDLEPPVGRLIYRDAWQAPDLDWEGSRVLHNGLSAELDETDLAKLPSEELARADGIVRRLDLEAKDGTRLATPESWSERITLEPRFLRLRGPPLVVATRKWRRLSEPFGAALAACGTDCFTASLPPDLESGDLLTVFTWVPLAMTSTALPRVLLMDADGEEHQLQLHATSRKNRGLLSVTRRFPATWAAQPLRFVAEDGFGSDFEAHLEKVQVEIHRWQLAAADPHG